MGSPKHILQLTLKTASISVRWESATCAAPSSCAAHSSCPYVCAGSRSLSLYQPMDPPRSTSFYFFRPSMCYISLCYFWVKCVWGFLFLPTSTTPLLPSYGPIIFLCKGPCVQLPDPILPHYLLLSSIGLLARIFRFYPNSFTLFNLKKFESELHNTFLHRQGRPHFRSDRPSPSKFLTMFSTVQIIATQFQIQ